MPFSLRFALSLGLLFSAGCGLKYDGVTPSPFPESECGQRGCAWNAAKARCECWNRPNPDGRNVEKGANF